MAKKIFRSHSRGLLLDDWPCMKAPEVLRNLSDVCRLKHLSYATEKSYAGWVQSYSRAVARMPKAWTSEKKAEAFLTGLAKREVAAATQNQAA